MAIIKDDIKASRQFPYSSTSNTVRITLQQALINMATRKNPNIISSSDDDGEGREHNVGYGAQENRIGQPRIVQARRSRSPIRWPGQGSRVGSRARSPIRYPGQARRVGNRRVAPRRGQHAPRRVAAAIEVQTDHTGPVSPVVVVQSRLSRRRLQRNAETTMVDDDQMPSTSASGHGGVLFHCSCCSRRTASSTSPRASTSAQAGIKPERASGMEMVRINKEVVRSYFLKDLPEYEAPAWHRPQFSPAEGGLDSESVASEPEQPLDPFIYYGSDASESSSPSLD